MNTWAAPGVKCVRIGTDDNWIDLDTLRAVTPPGEVEVTIFKIVEVMEFEGYIVIGLWGTVLDQFWDVRQFRPIVYPEQSLEHDVQLFTKIADGAPAPKKLVRA